MDQKTQRSRAFPPTLCHGVARIFLTAPLSYDAVALHRGQCEQLLRYVKLATSSIYSLVSSYGYNGRQIGQRVAQELAVHWASHGGPAKRTKRRPSPHAQPVAYVRQRSGRWPLLTPRGCTTPAPRSDGGQPCGRTWEETRHHRSLVPRDARPTRRSSFRLLVMASPYWMIYGRY